jgi:hypothetical protein
VFSLKWPSAISIYRQIWRYSENESRKSLSSLSHCKANVGKFLAKQFPRKQRIYNKIGIPITKYFSQNGENFATKKKKKKKKH